MNMSIRPKMKVDSKILKKQKKNVMQLGIFIPKIRE